MRKTSFLSLLFTFISFSLISLELTPQAAVDKLIEGNKRYLNSETVCHNDWGIKRTALMKGQNPFAVIISCSDSRVPPEIIFDQSLGDLFVVRVAGNVIDDYVLGSVEYAVRKLGATLILVLGHAQCGAVEATLADAKFDNHIQSIVDAIKPSVKDLKASAPDSLEIAIKNNVKRSLSLLKDSKPVLSELAAKNQIKMIGGYYHLDTGSVEILE